MGNVQEIDVVLQFVRQITRILRLSADAAVTQQILLLGDSFYGYRFTAPDYTAVWSAAEQTLKVFDKEGKNLGLFSLSAVSEPETVTIPASQRRAA